LFFGDAETTAEEVVTMTCMGHAAVVAGMGWGTPINCDELIEGFRVIKYSLNYSVKVRSCPVESTCHCVLVINDKLGYIIDSNAALVACRLRPQGSTPFCNVSNNSFGYVVSQIYISSFRTNCETYFWCFGFKNN